MSTAEPKALVSIILPTFNPGVLVRETIQSVIDQSYPCWELLIVDDGSTQDVTWIEEEFPAARVFRQPHLGVSAARNYGILISSGEYIALIDQDDLWLPEKLSQQVDAATSDQDAAAVYCDLLVFSGEAPPLATAAASGPLRTLRVLDPKSGGAGEHSNLKRSVEFFSQQFIVPSTVLLRRECLAVSGLMDPFLPFSGDYDLLIKLGAHFPVVRIAQVGVLYRRHTGNFSNRYLTGRAEVRSLTKRYVDFARSQGDTTLARSARSLFLRPRRLYAAQAFDGARAALAAGHPRLVAYHLAQAMRFSPFFTARIVLLHFKNRGGLQRD